MNVGVKKQSGVALVIVLWMLTLMAIMALNYTRLTKNEIDMTKLFIDQAKARALAEAGTWIAIDELLKPQQDETWPRDGTKQGITFEGHQLSLYLQDENGLVDLNTASPALLNVILQKTATDTLADEIVEWRSSRNMSSQKTEFDSKNPKNSLFNDVSELQRLENISSEIYETLKPSITIHSHQSGINIKTAPKDVLLMFPEINVDNIDAALEARQQNKTDELIMSYGIDKAFTTNLQGPVYTIHSTAQYHNATAILSVKVIIRQAKDRPFSVLSWAFN